MNGGDVDIRYTDSKTTQLESATVTVGTAVTVVLGACPATNGNVLDNLDNSR